MDASDKDNPLIKLDTVLTYLYYNNTHMRTFDEISNWVKEQVNSDDNEVGLIILKLKDDKYIIQQENPIKRQEYLYNITFDGMVFLKQGGYNLYEIYLREKNERVEKLGYDQMAIQKNMQTLTGLIAVATVVASVYYLIEICKQFHWFGLK